MFRLSRFVFEPKYIGNELEESDNQSEGERMSEDWRERMERQMAFIVEQQAQYEVRSAKADERWAQADARWAQADERWAKGDE